MSPLKRRLRSLLIALAVLALSAGAVMAGRGSHPATPPQTAGPEAADQGDQNEVGDQDEGGTDAEAPEPPEVETPEVETPDAGQQPDSTQAPTPDTGSGVHPDNHGKLVSEAAHAGTQTGFDNHGAYVRTVAHKNAGAASSAKGKATSAAAKAKHQTH